MKLILTLAMVIISTSVYAKEILSLPDPLKTISGKIVKSSKMWEDKRRPEILELFQTNIYYCVTIFIH